MTCPFKRKEAKSEKFRFVTSKAAPLLGRYLIRDPKENTQCCKHWPAFLGGLRSQFHISKAGSEEFSSCTCLLAWEGSLIALEVATPSCPPLTGEQEHLSEISDGNNPTPPGWAHTRFFFYILVGFVQLEVCRDCTAAPSKLLTCSRENERFEIIVHFPLTQTNSHHSDVFKVPVTGWSATLPNWKLF